MDQASTFNLVTLAIFAFAIVHTFLAGNLRRLESRLKSSRSRAVVHVMSEVEVIFALWVIPLAVFMLIDRGLNFTWDYFTAKVTYTEPLFVLVIMVHSVTRPILNLAENFIRFFARIGGLTPAAWWLSILTFAPILGSLITEPAAMTIAALLLGRYFYDLNPSARFSYATLGLLFVNVSVGGVLTNFAAPPVLMVAGPWNWSSGFMLSHFGWKACTGIFLANAFYFFVFRQELSELARRRKAKRDAEYEVSSSDHSNRVPLWITLTNVFLMFWTVWHSHEPLLFLGGFAVFLIYHALTVRHQNKLALHNAILVGLFLAGLVAHGSLQGWWISKLLSDLSPLPMMLSSIALTSFNDNAAITFLSTLIPNLSDELKYAVVAGAVTGGGLTVIANAPNPAGQAILSKFFAGKVIAPAYLFLGALVPTLIMGFCFCLC